PATSRPSWPRSAGCSTSTSTASEAPAPMAERLLGIDVGTSSVKGVVCDGDGTIRARASVALRTSMPRPGWVEQDAEADWWAGIRAVCDELLATEPRPAAVCVSGLGPCLLPTDD